MEAAQSSEPNRQALLSAIALHKSGRLEEAEAAYLGILGKDRNDPDAMHYLGVLLFQRGHPLLAIDFVRKALQIRPDNADALNNLGNIYQQLGGPADAAKAYKMALEEKPDHPQAERNLAIALEKVKRLEESAEEHRQAIEREPANAERLYALADIYMDISRIDEAMSTMKEALAIEPEPARFRRLGQMLYGMRRIDEAAVVYEAWLRAEPENPTARHMLAACTLKDVPARADDAFVTETFDRFAGSFDEVLLLLEYRAPALVGEALRRLDGEPRSDLDIVDAGCGTGLLARYLRPHARRLIGVDLSRKMIAQAAKRAMYDDIVEAELTGYLRGSPAAFDVVASSDTLVYFGDLREVLTAAHAALRPQGRLVFTLEHAANDADAPQGYRLQPHGRYVHTETYVRNMLSGAGLEVIDIDKQALRREGSSHVAGLLVLARRAGAPNP